MECENNEFRQNYEALGESFFCCRHGSSWLVIDCKMTSFLKIKDCNKNVSSKCINSVLLSASGIPDVFLDKTSYFEQNSKSLVVRNTINTTVSLHFWKLMVCLKIIWHLIQVLNSLSKHKCLQLHEHLLHIFIM